MPEKKTTKRRTHKQELSIVGIGASAGGLAALKTFFSNVPGNSGLAYVVVVHLSPDYKSILAELIQPVVDMPVQQVTKNTQLEANHIYVIPPNANLNSVDTHLRLSRLEEKNKLRTPIDHFFKTLAKTHDGDAAGVILTGTGSDGTLGIKRVKEKGGLAIVQDPEEAEYNSMPLSALASDSVDVILPLKEIPVYLLKYFQTKTSFRVVQDISEIERDNRKIFHFIISLLKHSTGRDFSSYKISTILRRIQRRMQMHQTVKLDDYYLFLRQNKKELKELSDDLLINVTSFFRDREIFDHIKNKVLPEILQSLSPDEQLRVWSAGCATGEEAYSLGMIITEAIDMHDEQIPFQIFASDLHEKSLEKARQGCYKGEISSDVSPERLSKFFTQDDGGYKVDRQLREKIIFTPHDLLRDPPFSSIHLVVCRNLLIYLNKEIKKKIYSIFHYALKPKGYLVLGSSETTENSSLFAEEHKKFSIYSKNLAINPEAQQEIFPLPAVGHLRYVDIPRKTGEGSNKTFYHKLIEKHGHASIIISEDLKVLYVSEAAGQYLNIKAGELSSDIFSLIDNNLRTGLRTALYRSKNQKVFNSRPISIRVNKIEKKVSISVKRINNPDRDSIILILISDSTRFISEEAEPKEDKPENSYTRELEIELQEKGEQLQNIIEQYETNQEEIQASNEELQSANEELRSTVEELETSKEELQSMNEELNTLNQENKFKVSELDRLTNDLNNFLASTNIATVFVDKQKRILRFTPRISDFFNIRQSDLGRSIFDQSNKLLFNKLEDDIERVINDLQPHEREVEHNDGKIYLMRLIPYRTEEDKIDGVVITFIDVNDQKILEKNLRKSRDHFEALVKSLTNSVYRMSPDWKVMHELSGKGFISDTNEPDPDWLNKYIHPEDQEYVLKAIDKAIGNKSVFSLVHRVLKTDKSIGWTHSQAVPILDENKEIVEWFGSASDISQQKKYEEKINEAKVYAEMIIDTIHEPLLVLTSELRVKTVNPAFLKTFKVRKEETLNKSVYDLGNGQWNIPELRRLLEKVLPDNHIFNDFEVEHEFESIGKKNMLLNARRLDHVQLILLGIRDITKEKKHELALRKSEERLLLTFDSLKMGTWEIEEGTDKLQVDPGGNALLGMKKAKREIGIEDFYQLIHPEDRKTLKRTLKNTWENGGEMNTEYRIRVNGEIRWLASRCRIVHTSGKRRMIGVNYDITERIKTQKELRESEARRLIAIESADIGDWWMNTETREMFWSEKVSEMLGMQEETKENFKIFLKYIHPEDKDRMLQELHDATQKENEGEYNTEYRIIRPDGKEIWINSRAKTLIFETDYEKSASFLYGAMIDITDRKKTEEALNKSREEAEAAAKVKEEFLAHMSHEIRTPLNAIVGLAHLLLKRNPKKDQVDNLQTLNISAENLSRLINNILDFSKIQAGKISVNTENIRLPQMIGNIYRMHKPRANEKKIRLKKEIGKNVPENIISDEMKVSQVLNNLISNAVKFTNKGEVKLTVNTEKRKKEKIWIKFSVEDTGIGIPENKQKSIFDVFTQGDSSTSRNYEGTGLGLTITRLYLNMLGSDIEVESEVGKGSRFSFTLAVEIDGKSGDYHEENEFEIPFQENLDKFQILIVEDDDFNRLIITQLFDIWDIKYDEAEDGRAALKMAEENDYALILMDVRMPVMDGFEATKKIRKIPGYEKTSIIALTADISQSVREAVDSGLFSEMSIKPIEPEKLKKKIIEIARGSRGN